MELQIGINEIAYIQKRFNFKVLFGIEPFICNEQDAEKQLLESKLIYPVRDSYELDNHVRFIFYLWSNAHLVLSRPDLSEKYCSLALLANENDMMYFLREGDRFVIRCCPITEDIIDAVVSMIIGFEEKDEQPVQQPFNVRISITELNILLGDLTNENLDIFCKRHGLSQEIIRDFVAKINPENATERSVTILNTQNKQIGADCKTRIVTAPNAVYAVKRIIYKNGEQKAVIIKGNAQFVTQCIYNF